MIRTAIALALKGLAVFPCRPQDKRPATANGLKDATTDLDKIRQWWRQEPQFNLAIATGAVSGIFVVDIDGLDAEVELRRLEAEHGEIPSTIEAITARGRHVYFRSPEIPVRNSVSKIAPGIDVRGDGGYVLAPPSHVDGKHAVDTALQEAVGEAAGGRADVERDPAGRQRAVERHGAGEELQEHQVHERAYLLVVDGQIVGTWRRTLNKDTVSIKIDYLSRVTKAQMRAVAAAAERYGTFLGKSIIMA